MRHVLLQLVGLATFAVGLGLVYPPAGVIATGVGLFAVGLLLDQPRKSE